MERKLRNTIQRDLVLSAVNELKNHPTADDVYDLVARKCKHISLATVYTNLKVLSERGDILKIEVPNQPTRYDHNIEKHYHFRCKRCGRLFDSDIPYDENLIKGLRQSNGFVVEDFNLILIGLCPDCINKKQKEN